MKELIDRIVAATGLDAAVVERAVGLILAFLAKEGPSDEIDRLFAGIPGAQQAVSTVDPATVGGGIMGLGQKLMASGVSMGQMQILGRELFAHGREKAGEDTMGSIMGSIPGLGQFV